MSIEEKTKEIEKEIKDTELEDYWDVLCSDIGYDEEGLKLQEHIKNFCEAIKTKALKSNREELIKEMEGILKKNEEDMKEFWNNCHTTTPKALADIYNQAIEEVIKKLK